jgi:hypothetical protein
MKGTIILNFTCVTNQIIQVGFNNGIRTGSSIAQRNFLGWISEHV